MSLLEGYGCTPILVTGGFDGEAPAAVHQRFAAALDDALDEIAAIQHARARDGSRVEAAALADDRPAHAEGLDRPEGGRRPASRGHVALASGPARRRARQPRAPAAARGLDEELPAGGAVRRERGAAPRARRPPAEGRAADEREPARERRPAAARARSARLSRLRGRGAEAGNVDERSDARARHVPARRDREEPGQLPALRSRRDGVEPARRRLRRDEPELGRRDEADRRSASHPTVA